MTVGEWVRLHKQKYLPKVESKTEILYIQDYKIIHNLIN